MKVQFAPGVVSEISPNAVANGWIDSDLVRFRYGCPESIGGWVNVGTKGVQGVCRSLYEWSSNVGSARIAIGTSSKLYLLSFGSLYDVTPQRNAVALGANPFSTVSDPSKLQVVFPFHSCISGDFIAFSGSSSGCDTYSTTDLNTEFQVAQVVDLNTLLLFGAKTTSSPGIVGGGTGVVALPEIQSGNIDAVLADGFGIGPYGVGTFGSPRIPTGNSLGEIILEPRIWHMDNFGEDLIVNPSGGGIYIWHSASGFSNRATPLSSDPLARDVPMYASGVFVSVIDQNVVALGCSPYGATDPDPMQIRWADQQNPYMWTPLSSNVAGGYRLPSGSAIIGWLPTYYETLIWTDTTMYSMQFVPNQSVVYGFNVIGKGFSIVSPKAAVTNGSTVFWMDRGCFYTYNGTVAELPCSVKSRVFKNLNTLQSWKIHAAHNHSFSEVWWFYPSNNSTEIDSYVIYNYKDNVWSVGYLSRTAWSDSGRRSTPLAIDPSGALYFHEDGTDANGYAMESWIESGDIDIQGGEQFALLHRIVPDVTFVGPGTHQNMTLSVMARNAASQPRKTLKTFTLQPYVSNRGFIDTKVRGRKLSLKLESSSLGTGWRMGQFEVNISANGKR